MFRSPRSRNGRTKGLKIKHVFQISLLLGVSLWLLYQVHHSDDKKVSNITHKLRNVHSKDMNKLGRKDLRPKVKEIKGKDSKETEEHQSDEQGNQSEDEEVANDHESEEGEDMKHDEVGEDEHEHDREESDEKEGGTEKTTKTEYDDKEKGREKSGVKNKNIKTEPEDKHRDDGGNKNETVKGEKGEKGNKGNEKGKEKRKENLELKNKNKDEGRKKEMKQVQKTKGKEDERSDGGEQIKGKVNEEKSNEQNKVVEKSEIMSPNMKEVEIASPSEDHDQNVRKEGKNDKIMDKGKRENESGEGDISPDSYSVPSIEYDSADLMKDDGDSEGQAKEQVSNEKDDVSVLEDEKDALTDLGTLPESETGGSISHDDAATE